MSTARAELERLIKVKEDELRALKTALRALEQNEIKSKSSGRFIDMRPFDAVLILLSENSGRMKRPELEQALMDGGIAVGKKRGHHNVRISIDTNLKLGNLVEDNGWIKKGANY